MACPKSGKDLYVTEQTNSRFRNLFAFLAVIGPGLTVMLADTDAGSIITAAQSGAQWGYKLLLVQLLLIPVLYFVQELTTHIGITTGRGHGELIKEQFGMKWAWVFCCHVIYLRNWCVSNRIFRYCRRGTAIWST